MESKKYQEELDWLYDQQPNYQIDGKKAYKPGLENIKALCAHFGDPQNRIKTIHVGGTNGKGSTTHMLAAILQSEGYKVGLFTSPHLIHFTERIKINGENAEQSFVSDFIKKLKLLPEDIKPSFFEFTTIMAFEYFALNEVDFAIIEVGLGGRLDSTNIITPIISAITNIDLDHQDILGETLEKIAYEKAGIIKKNVPIVSGETRAEIKNIFNTISAERKADWVDSSNLGFNFPLELKGDHQIKNAKVVLGIVMNLKEMGIMVTEKAISHGFSNVTTLTNFMGRWMVVDQKPLTICDTAHNEAGFSAVLKQLGSLENKKHMVLGFVSDKKIEMLFLKLPKENCYYFAKPSISRGKNPKDYEIDLKKNKIKYKIFSTVWDAYLAAFQNCKEDQTIFIGGSNFVVGEFLEKKFGQIKF